MRKVKLNPTKEQKEKLRMFASHARYTYNAAVSSVNEKQNKLNKLGLRNVFVTAKNNKWIEERTWLLQTPKVIRQQAVFEAAKNFKACFTSKSNGHIDSFKVGHKTKRNEAMRGWTLGVERQLQAKSVDGAKKDLRILPEFLGSMRFYSKLPFDSKPAQDCFLHRDSTGSHYLMVPVTVDVKKPEATGTISLDPGVRKFLTGYSPDGGHGFFVGKETSATIMSILRSIDTVCSALSNKTLDHQARRRLRKKKLHLYRAFKNIRDDFHFKLANMLTKQYSTIVLPHLATKQLSQQLKAKTSREMLAQSHGLFLQRLNDKCEERGVFLASPTEHYTSKTCGSCGRLNAVGSSEVFSCRCGYVADRDLNAARNIYIKFLNES